MKRWASERHRFQIGRILDLDQFPGGAAQVFPAADRFRQSRSGHCKGALRRADGKA